MKRGITPMKKILTMTEHTFLYALSCIAEGAHNSTVEGYYTRDDIESFRDVLKELIVDEEIIQGEI